MYRKDNSKQLQFEDFYLPFGGKLRSDNRWVILSRQIPWSQVEQEYSTNFSERNAGCPAKSARVALGALIIKERLGATDRETVQQIAENPYLQFFLGFSAYKDVPPFDDSLMTHFRKRFDKDTLAGINALIVDQAMSRGNESQEPSEDDNGRPSNKGKLIVDATCTRTERQTLEGLKRVLVDVEVLRQGEVSVELNQTAMRRDIQTTLDTLGIRRQGLPEAERNGNILGLTIAVMHPELEGEMSGF